MRNAKILLGATALLLLLSATSQCFAQLSVFPSASGKYAGFVSSKEPGGWLVVKEGFVPVSATVSEDKKSVVWEGDPGTYGVIFFIMKEGIVTPVMQPVTLGGGSVVPPPVPPGAKWAMILEESGVRSAQVGNLIVQIRKDPVLSKLTQVQDKDAQAAYVQRIVKLVPSTYSYPVLAIVSSVDNATKIVQMSESNPPTVAQIKEYLK